MIRLHMRTAGLPLFSSMIAARGTIARALPIY